MYGSIKVKGSQLYYPNLLLNVRTINFDKVRNSKQKGKINLKIHSKLPSDSIKSGNNHKHSVSNKLTS